MSCWASARGPAADVLLSFFSSKGKLSVRARVKRFSLIFSGLLSIKLAGVFGSSTRLTSVDIQSDRNRPWKYGSRTGRGVDKKVGENTQLGMLGRDAGKVSCSDSSGWNRHVMTTYASAHVTKRKAVLTISQADVAFLPTGKSQGGARVSCVSWTN